MGDSLVVIDCETTGLYRTDRIVEVAVVVLDSNSLEIVDEFDTLVNPERDVGPVDVHGVTASMVEAAPTFSEIAGVLGNKLDGGVLVAHNLSFDARMIAQEFDRLESQFDPGEGICTLKATAERLINACERYGIALTHQHRALADARATAQLLVQVLEDDPTGLPAFVDCSGLELNPRTLRRDALDTSGGSGLSRIISKAKYPSSDHSVIQYLDMLDWVLDDMVITNEERNAMSAITEELGLDSEQVIQAHESYLRSIVAAAQRDGQITEAENKLMVVVADALGVETVSIPEVTDASGDAKIHEGMRVCFTGNAAVSRNDLEAIAAAAGLQPVSSVTKKGCDLLVAADSSSMSGKVKKARDYGIPVISVEEFLQR